MGATGPAARHPRPAHALPRREGGARRRRDRARPGPLRARAEGEPALLAAVRAARAEGAAMTAPRRLHWIAAVAAAVLSLALAARAAEAHPLGNFSINHLAVVSIGRSDVDV